MAAAAVGAGVSAETPTLALVAEQADRHNDAPDSALAAQHLPRVNLIVR